MNSSVSTMSGKIKLKIIFLGNQSVGKSSIIQKYVKDYFYQSTHPTVGIDFLIKKISYRGKIYRLQLWDTAGQQRFQSLIPNFMKDAKCALIVTDVANKKSFDSANAWYQMYSDNKNPDSFALLLGNKIDLSPRQVSKQQGKKKGQELGIPYYQLSAKTGQNIQTIFHKIIDISQQNIHKQSHQFSNSNPKLSTLQNHDIKQNFQQFIIEQDKPNLQIYSHVNGQYKQNTNIILKKNIVVDSQNQKKIKKKSKCC